jgi:hypothetical protein
LQFAEPVGKLFFSEPRAIGSAIDPLNWTITMNAVPFTIELFGGLGQCDGLLRDEGKQLAMEFQIKDTLAGLIKTNVRQIQIPLKDLVSVTLMKGWLGTSWLGVKLVLQAARMDILQDVPGMNQGRIELSVARKDRDAAERFVADLHQVDELKADA